MDKLQSLRQNQASPSGMLDMFSSDVGIQPHEEPIMLYGEEPQPGTTSSDDPSGMLAMFSPAPKSEDESKADEWAPTKIARSFGVAGLKVAGGIAAGLSEYAGEAPVRDRQKIQDAVGTILRKGNIEKKKPEIPSTKDFEVPSSMLDMFSLPSKEGVIDTALKLGGEAVKFGGDLIETYRNTSFAKALAVRDAKAHLLESAYFNPSLTNEVRDLIKKAEKTGDDSLYQKLARKLQDKEAGGFKPYSTGEQLAIKGTEVATKVGDVISSTAKKLRPVTKKGSLMYYGTSAIEGLLPSLGLGVLTTVVTKNPSAGLAMMFPQVLGEDYHNRRANGASTTEAARGAVFIAATEVLSEMTPLGILTKAGGKFVTRFFKSASAEGLQEALNEAVQIAYDEGIIGEDTPPEEIGRRLLDAGIIGAIGGGGLSLAKDAGSKLFGGKTKDTGTDKDIHLDDPQPPPTLTKDEILDAITETIKTQPDNIPEAVSSVGKSFAAGILTEDDIDQLKQVNPDLSNDFDVAIESEQKAHQSDQLRQLVDQGLKDGFIGEEPFLLEDTLNVIQDGVSQGLLTPDDIKYFSDAHPELTDGLASLFSSSSIKKQSPVRETLPAPEEQGMSAKEILTGQKEAPVFDLVKPAEAPTEIISVPEETRKEDASLTPIKEGELINGITRKAAGEKIAKDDASVIPHIKEGVDQHGKMQMQDAIRNQILKEVASAKTPEARSEIIKKSQSVWPGVEAALKGESVALEQKVKPELRPETKLEPELEPEPESEQEVKPAPEPEQVKPDETEIPAFMSTEAAVAYGKTANDEQIQQLKQRRDDMLSQLDAATKAGASLDSRMRLATQAQLYREAFEAREEDGSEPKPEPVAKAKVKLDSLNPTGGLFAEYSPEKIASMELGENITTLDKTANKEASDTVIIYRGAPKEQTKIVPGDFVTTNKQLAKDYAGTGIVLEKEVRMADVLDDSTDPLQEEYIYKPKPKPAHRASSALEPTPQQTPAQKTKEPWETSDLKTNPNLSIDYLQAKKQLGGRYRLFFRGTRNEVFQGEDFRSAAEARNFFKAQKIKAQEATKAKAPDIEITGKKNKTVEKQWTEIFSLPPGDIVFADNDIGLKKGFNLLGLPVYLGIQRRTSQATRVDISNYTGNLFSKAELKKLIAQKEIYVNEQKEKLVKHPNGCFTSKEPEISGTDGMPDSYVGILKEWLGLVGIKGRIFLVNPADINENFQKRYKLYGEFEAVNSLRFSKGTASTRIIGKVTSGDHVINLPLKTSKAANIETMAHEFGHILQKELLGKASEQERASVNKAYREWAIKNGGEMNASQLIALTRGYFAGAELLEEQDPEQAVTFSTQPGFTSFKEWFADNVSKWAVSTKEPLTVVDKFFKRVAKQLRAFYTKLIGKGYLPNKTVKDLLDSWVALNKKSFGGEVTLDETETPTKGLFKNQFYVRNSDETLRIAEGTPVKIKSFEDYEFFYSKVDGEFVISEASTGGKVSGETTLKAAKAKISDMTDAKRKHFKEIVKKLKITDKQIAEFEKGYEKERVAAPDETSQGKETEGAKIEDVGEKLGGARKDIASLIKSTIADDDIPSHTLSEIWPKPKLEDLDNSFESAFVFAARLEIPGKPRTRYKVKRWAEQVRVLRGLSEKLLSGEENKQTIATAIAKQGSNALGTFLHKVNVLEKIDKNLWSKITRIEVRLDNYLFGKNNEKIKTPIIRINRNIYKYKKDFTEVTPDIEKDLKADIDKPKKSMRFEVRGSIKRGFTINKKGDAEYRPLKKFKTSEEAFEYRAKHPDELVVEWEKVKARDNVRKTDVRNKLNRARTGKDHRQGKDIGAEEFRETFGFRGVEFGLWVKQGKNAKDRQGMVNAAYDAFLDLAAILNIPPKAISLNNKLGLGFGSRGHGAAAAHFEPDTFIINLTKPHGAGSLAHEWFHALDNYFQRERGINKGSDERFITYRPETVYQNKKTGVTITKRSYTHVRKNREDWVRVEGVRPEVEQIFADLVKVLNESGMYKRSRKLDTGKKPYWSQIIERAARSFENYIIGEMATAGYNNDYLANVTAVEHFTKNLERYPYLTADELTPVKEAFDNLFKTIKTKKTDSGVILYKTSKETKPQDTITKADLKQMFSGMKNISVGQDLRGNFFFVPRGGKRITIKEVNHVDGYIATSAGRIPVGSYLKDTIQLKTSGKGPTADIQTAWHEFEHFLETSNILTTGDIAALNIVIGQEKGIRPKEVTAEQRADYVGDRLSSLNSQKAGRIKRILQKILDFMNTVYELVAQVRTAKGVVRDIKTGKILNQKELTGVNQLAQTRSDIRFQETADRFYSQVIKTIKDKMPDKMQASAVMNWLKKQPGIKVAELEWMNIEEMLEGKKSVEKDELVKLLKENQVIIEEVAKGADVEDVWYLEYKDGSGRIGSPYKTVAEAEEALEETELADKIRLQKEASVAIQTTKYSQYQLEGKKENYREFFLTMPNTKEYFWEDGHSEYSDVRNPIVRLRVNERISEDGDKILFLEEIQKPSPEQQKEMPAFAQKNAIEMGLKRLIRMAAEQGIDEIAWINGQQTADRYSLSKQVDEIIYTNNGRLIAYGDGTELINESISENEIENYIGKTPAEKIINAKEAVRSGIRGRYISGGDLKVGGKWAVRLYDQMIPQFFKKFGKKYGARVGTVEINGKEQQSLAITPELKKAALFEGMPLFQVEAWHGSPDKFDRFDLSHIGEGEGRQSFGYGLYFTDLEGVARHYAKTLSEQKRGTRNLYKVSLHKGNSPSEYTWLDWNKRAPDSVLRKIEQDLGAKVFPDANEDEYGLPIVKDGQALYETIASIKGGEKEASLYLLGIGIDGIRYPVGAFFGKEDTGHKNYVVFDEQSVTIEETIQFSTKPDLSTVAGVMAYAREINKTKETKELNRETLNGLKRFIKDYNEGKIKEEKPDFIRLANIFMSPEFEFEKVPAAQRVLEASINSKDMRYNLQKTMLTMGKKADLLKPVNELAKNNGKEFNALQTFIKKNKGIINLQMLKKQGFSFEAREAWHSWDRAVNMTPFREGDDLLTAFRQLRKENKAEYKRLEKSITAADVNHKPLTVKALKAARFSDLAVTAWLGRREQLNRGLDMLMENARQALIEYERAGEPAPKVVVESKDGEKIKINMKEALAQMGDARDYYNPRNRPQGRHKVFIGNKKGNAVLFFSDMPKKAIKAMAALKYPSSKGYAPVVIENTKSLSESVFESQTKTMDAQSLVNKALEKINSNLKKQQTLEDFGVTTAWETTKKGDRVLTVKAPYSELNTKIFTKPSLKGEFHDGVWHFPRLKTNAEGQVLKALQAASKQADVAALLFAEEIAENLGAVFKERGFLKYKLRRSLATGAKVVMGFETDPILNATQYVMGIAGGTAKKIKASEMLNAFTGGDVSWTEYQKENPEAEYKDYIKFKKDRGIDPSSQKVAYAAVKKYMIENLRNDEFVDRVFGVFRGLAVFKYLAFRIPSALVNTTVMLTSLPATISTETGASINRALTSTIRAIKDYSIYLWRDKTNLSTATIRMFDTIYDNGWHQAQLNQEAIMELQGKVGRGYSKALEWGMYLFGLTEQLNRVASIAGAAIANQDMSKEGLRKAKKISDLANGIYGKETLPVIAQTGELTGQLFRMFYTFAKFPHTYLQNMARMGKAAPTKKTAFKNITYMMLSPAILGGATAVPGWSLLMLLLEKLFGADDPEEEVYKTAFEYLGETTENIARYGLPGAPEHGITIKHSLSIDLTDLPDTIPELLGAPASVVTDITKGIKELSEGHLLKAGEYAFPSFAGRGLKAVREATEGIRTKTGSYIFVDGKQIRPDNIDTFWTAAGFSSTRIAKLRDKRWHQIKISRKYSNMRAAVTEEYKDFKLASKRLGKLDVKRYKKVMNAMREYNKRVRQYKLTATVPMLTKRKLDQSWNRAVKPNKRGL